MNDKERDRILKTFPPSTQQWLAKVREETDAVFKDYPESRRARQKRSISQQTEAEREEFQVFMDKVFSDFS